MYVFPQQTVGSFYTPFKPCVLIGTNQCSQLVSTSWPLAFINPFLVLLILHYVLQCPWHTSPFRWQLLPHRRGQTWKMFAASLFCQKFEGNDRIILLRCMEQSVKAHAVVCIYLIFPFKNKYPKTDC